MMVNRIHEPPKLDDPASATGGMSGGRLSWVLGHGRQPLHRSAYALVASAGATLVLGLAFWSVAARMYEPVAVGTQSAVISAMLLLGGIAELGLATLLIRFLPVAMERRRLLLFAYAASSTAAVVVAGVFVLGTSAWSPPLEFVRSDAWWFAGFLLATAMTCIFSLQDSVLTGFRRATWVPVENGLVSAMKLVLLVSLADVFTNAGIFISWLIPGLCAVVGVNVLVFRRLLLIRSRPHDATNLIPGARGLVRYAFGNYVGSLFALLAINALPLLVIGRLGAAPAAYFVMPWAIYNGLQLIAASVAFALLVEVAGDPENLRSYFRRALAQTMALLVPAAVVVALLGPTLLALAGGRYVEEGRDLLRLLAVASIPGALVPMALAHARLRNRAGVVAVIQGGSSILLLSISYVLLADHGITGVGIAALTTTVLVGAVLFPAILWPAIRPPVRSDRLTPTG